MTEISCRYLIRFSLPSASENPASIGAKFVETLDALSRTDAANLGNWNVMNFQEKSSLPLASARSRIATVIQGNVRRDDLGDPAPRYGYSAVAFTGNVLKSRQFSLRIKAGGIIIKTENWLETGQWKILPDPAIVTFPLFKEALLAMNTIWSVPWACAQAFRANTVRVPVIHAPGVTGYRYESAPMIPSDPTFPESIFHIPWFVYLSAQLATSLVLPPPEILTERTPDGGLLMIATEDRLDPENAEHRRRARILAEIMIARIGYRSGDVSHD